MMACATPLASTIATGARIASASPRATSGQAVATRRVHSRRDASPCGTSPASTRPSPISRELPSAAATSVE